jgi:hypothetical protein
MAPPRQECCKRGHRIADHAYVFPSGRRSCRLCRLVWKRARNARMSAEHQARREAKRLAQMPTLPDVHGEGRRQRAARLAWARRRAKYGPSGMSLDALARSRANGHRLIVHTHRVKRPLSPTCRRGHRLAGPNLRIYFFRDKRNGRQYRQRRCGQCERLRSRGRPEWIEHGGVRVSLMAHDAWFVQQEAALRAAMIAAHPDKGGTARKFMTARTALGRFYGRETAWYAEYGFTPPGTRAMRAAIAA